MVRPISAAIAFSVLMLIQYPVMGSVGRSSLRLGQLPDAGAAAGSSCYVLTETGEVFDLSAICGRDPSRDRNANSSGLGGRHRRQLTQTYQTIPGSGFPGASRPALTPTQQLGIGARYAEDLDFLNF
jgi:hypothetical protein